MSLTNAEMRGAFLAAVSASGDAARELIAEATAEQPTLRDRFAMAALQGLIASGRTLPADRAQGAYWYADQMLAARAANWTQEEETP